MTPLERLRALAYDPDATPAQTCRAARGGDGLTRAYATELLRRVRWPEVRLPAEGTGDGYPDGGGTGDGDGYGDGYEGVDGDGYGDSDGDGSGCGCGDGPSFGDGFGEGDGDSDGDGDSASYGWWGGDELEWEWYTITDELSP